MYPDESIKDSPAQKRREIYAKLFWVFVLSTLLLAATSIYLSFKPDSSSVLDAVSEPISSSSPSASPTSSALSSEVIENCEAIVATMPGDLEIVLSWGWEVECVESGGDPSLGENGLLDDLYTVGYADYVTKKIALDAPEVNAAIIAHEAAHAVDFEQLVQADRQEFATKYEAADWDNISDYFNRPSEMFAEARIRCLGFDFDSEYGVMSCEDVDALIAGTEQAEKILELVNSAP
jgi:hypothetical protein